MPWLIEKPAILPAHGDLPKEIQEYVGRVNTGHAQLSVARMSSPAGWTESYQQPEFMEISVVLGGVLRVWHDSGVVDVRPGQAIITQRGERVRYETPEPERCRVPGDLACRASLPIPSTATATGRSGWVERRSAGGPRPNTGARPPKAPCIGPLPAQLPVACTPPRPGAPGGIAPLPSSNPPPVPPGPAFANESRVMSIHEIGIVGWPRNGGLGAHGPHAR